ncbi:hypothetical protein X739_22320 [Mesorhizobium sp. LNHC220B00]|nr:hypothetical protein X739_22320 [Mesorhizobium sp. LNHC220B00]
MTMRERSAIESVLIEGVEKLKAGVAMLDAIRSSGRCSHDPRFLRSEHLESDIRHLSTLINVITEKALEYPGIGDVTDLLWIARDLAEKITTNSQDVCSSQNIVRLAS